MIDGSFGHPGTIDVFLQYVQCDIDSARCLNWISNTIDDDSSIIIIYICIADLS